jgi:hypothetical protein
MTGGVNIPGMVKTRVGTRVAGDREPNPIYTLQIGNQIYIWQGS